MPWGKWDSRVAVIAACVAMLTPALVGGAGPPSRDVEKLVSAWDKRDSPGGFVGIIREGKLIHERGFGMANLDHGLPITRESVFPIASLSKQFTAVCVLLLAQQGVLSLDDDIRRFLPEMPKYDRRITVRHLLHHTSGIRDYTNELLPLMGVWWDDGLRDDEVVGLLARQKGLNFPPGHDFRYSNSGYRLLAVIVRRVSGKSLREYADEHIFRPLGMKHTHFHDDAGRIVKNRAAGYALTRAGKLEARAHKTEFVGDSGVMTTVGDFLLWDRNLDRSKIGKPGFLDQLLAPGKLNDGGQVPYALGLNLGRYRGLRTVWHSGSAYSGFRSMYLRFPEQRFSVVVFANSTGPRGFNAYRLAHQLADLYLADSLQPVAPETPASTAPSVRLSKRDLESKQGAFLGPNGTPWVLAVKDGVLLVTVGVFSPPTYRTEALSPTRFRSADRSFRFEIEFQTAEAGSPPTLRVHPHKGKAFALQRVQLVTPTPAELKEYVGSYFSDELQATYRLEWVDDQLVLRSRNAPDSPLKPTVRDTFKARRLNGNLTITFTRGPGGKVTGFELAQADGPRDLHFTRRAK